jgi:SAM-dependent methyltransferase
MDVRSKEAQFHDAWAEITSPEQINIRAPFEALTSPENRFILRLMGTLRGKRVLDIGAGLGESSVYLALQGALVTSVDISPGMVNCARRLAALHHVNIDQVVCAAEELPFVDDSFDYVYASNIIHHTVDREGFFRQLRRVLKPGSTFYSWDPIAYNPVINLYRRMATKTRTEGERPLTYDDVELAKRFFVNVNHREFWIASLALFLKYYLWDGVHPNDDRYWKRILRETPSNLRWWRPLSAIDSLLTRLPLVKRLAWNIVLWGERS